MYFSSLGMRGKNVVGEGTEKIMPPEAVLTEEPKWPRGNGPQIKC